MNDQTPFLEAVVTLRKIAVLRGWNRSFMLFCHQTYWANSGTKMHYELMLEAGPNYDLRDEVRVKADDLAGLEKAIHESRAPENPADRLAKEIAEKQAELEALKAKQL